MMSVKNEVGNKPRPKKNGWIKDIASNPFSYLLLLPAGLYTLIFGYLTLPYIIIAFENYNFQKGMWHSDFVGLRNFRFFFESNSALRVTFNTVYLNLLFIVTGTVAAVGLALMLNEVRHKTYLKVTQSMLIFPNFISWIIVQYVVYSFLGTTYGWINKMLVEFGFKKINMYATAQPWPLILVLVRLWKGTGMSSVIYLAAITGMDEGLFEAARIDGANKAQQIIHITIPLLMPTISILTIMSIGKIFYGDFGMTYALVGDNGILLQRTDVIDTYVYRALRTTGDPSAAMAVGLYQAIVGFIMVYGSNKLARRFFPDGALF